MKKLVTLVSLIIVAVVSAQEESILLRLNYNEGDKYVMEMHVNEISSGSIVSEMLIEMPIEVTGINDGIYNSEMSFKRVKLNMDQAGVKMSYDSENKENEKEEEDLVKAQANKILSDQMNSILETVLATKTNVYGEVLEKKIVKGVNVDDYTSQAEGIIYPKEAITVGYSWESEKYNKEQKTTKTYTVKSITANEVIVDFKGSISGSSNRSLTGVININKTSGVATASHINMDFEFMGVKINSEVVIKMKKVG